MNPVNSSNSSHPSNPDRLELQHGSTSAPMNLKKVPGLYIHIPFCVRKCDYCDFYSVTSRSAIPVFLEALFKEMTMYCGEFDLFDTVYFGGGTPSVLRPEEIQDVLNTVRGNFDLSRKAGFDNLGLDLIYGVPGQGMTQWLETLTQAIGLLPEHLSCYQLTVEPHTPLGKRYGQREFSLPSEDLQYELFMKTSEILEGAGYVHYEVSNFARGMAFASRHNQTY